MERPRTEDDLRAAFTLAAQDAPSSDDVLAAVRAATTSRTTRAVRRERLRRWAPIAAVAAVVVAVAVPVGIAISDDKSGSASASSGTAYDLNGKAAAPEAAGSSAAAATAAGSVGSAGPGVVGGPINSPDPQGPESIPASAPSAGRTCAPADLTMTLSWTSGANGLTGVLEVINHTGGDCDLAVKPAVYPLDGAGHRLAVSNINSAEGYAGPQRLLSGAEATSTITWTNWCGAKAAARVEVDWGSGVGTIDVAAGPTTPACVSGAPTSISSGWFTPLS